MPLLQESWGPEQISGVFKESEYAVSHEWIDQRVLQDKQQGGQVYKERKLNDRPRKRLGWKTPRMLFEGVKLLN